MKKYQTIARLGLVAVLGLGLTITVWGCKGEAQGPGEPVITKKIAPAPQKAKSQARPLAAQEARQPNSPESKTEAENVPSTKMARLPYDPAGKLDPFKPLFREEPKIEEDKVTKPKKPERPRTPLERLDLGQLRLTAIVFSQNRPRAMVEEATGKGYVVELGTPIGLERGQVTKITRDRVVIEHLQIDDFGNSIPQRRELKLQKPPGD